MTPYDHIYRLPPPAGSARLWRFRAARASAWFIVIFGALLSWQTQQVASRIGGAYPLGEPLGRQIARSIKMESTGLDRWYMPPDSLQWMARFDKPGADPAVRALFAAERATLAVGGAVAALFAGAFFVVITLRSRPCGVGRLYDESHGSAHFADGREIRAMGVVDRPRGIYLAAARLGGRRGPGPKVYLRDDSERGVVVCGPPGSGKTSGVVIPTLLSDPDVSTVAFDLKGELHAATSGWAARVGKTVVRFDPYDETGASGKWNPFDAIRLGTRFDVDDARLIALHLCDALADNPGRSEGAVATSTILILHLLASDEYAEKNLRGFVTFLADRAAMTLTAILEEVAEKSAHGAVRRIARQQALREPREQRAVLSIIQASFGKFYAATLQDNTSRSDFSLRDLQYGEKPCALYFTVAPGRVAGSRGLIQLFFAQLAGILIERASIFAEDAPPDRRELRLLLDDCRLLGKLGLFEIAGTLRSYRVRACFVFHDLGEIAATYGGKDAIFQSCRTRVLYVPIRVASAQEISGVLGTQTRTWDERNYNARRIAYLPARGGFPLMTADQVMRLAANDALVLIEGQPPIFGTKFTYRDHPVFRERASLPPVGRSARAADLAPAVSTGTSRDESADTSFAGESAASAGEHA